MARRTHPGAIALHIGNRFDPTKERRYGVVDDASGILNKVVLHDPILARAGVEHGNASAEGMWPHAYKRIDTNFVRARRDARLGSTPMRV